MHAQWWNGVPFDTQIQQVKGVSQTSQLSLSGPQHLVQNFSPDQQRPVQVFIVVFKLGYRVKEYSIRTLHQPPGFFRDPYPTSTHTAPIKHGDGLHLCLPQYLFIQSENRFPLYRG